MSDLEILNPVARVKVGDREIEVRELAWPDALELFTRLGKRITGLLAEGLPPSSSDTAVAIGFGLRAITGSTDDLAFVLVKSTNLTDAQVRHLGTGAALRLLKAAMELTLNDEVLDAGKALAVRLGVAFGPISAPPSSSSSGAVIPGVS